MKWKFQERTRQKKENKREGKKDTKKGANVENVDSLFLVQRTKKKGKKKKGKNQKKKRNRNKKRNRKTEREEKKNERFLPAVARRAGRLGPTTFKNLLRAF